MLKSIFVAGAALCSSIFSVSAEARTFDFYIDVLSDPGIYDPITLGEDLNIDACGTSILRGPVTAANVATAERWSLCDITDVSAFELTYYVSESSTTALTPSNIIGSFSGTNVASGLAPTFATGLGTAFAAPGTYWISLVVTLPVGALVTIPGGDVVTPGSDCGLITPVGTFAPSGCTVPQSSSQPQINGARDTGFAATAIVANAATVPEPAAALLLIPALTLVAMRRRKKQ